MNHYHGMMVWKFVLKTNIMTNMSVKFNIVTILEDHPISHHLSCAPSHPPWWLQLPTPLLGSLAVEPPQLRTVGIFAPKLPWKSWGKMSLYRVFYHVLHHQNWINLDLWFTLILQIFRHIQTTPYDAYAVSFWSPSPSDWVLSQSLLLVRNLAPPQTEATEVVSAEIDQIDLISYLSDSIRLIRSL